MLVQPNRRRSASAPVDRPWIRKPGNIALALVGSAWIIVLTTILSHRIFVTNDALSNYIHVWYIADRFWSGHGVPLHMPVIGHGDAYAFPYAFIPWMSAALLRPLLGDWVVTLWLVVGAAGVIATQWWAFPELRGGWWTALLLLNPMLIEGPILGQLPFLWAVAMFFGAIALWRSDRPIAAALLMGLSQATHPAVMLPIVGPLVVARLWWEPKRGRLIAAYVASLAIAVPAVVLVLISPTVEDVSTKVLLGNFLGTVSLRALVTAGPFIALALRRMPFARWPAALMAILIVMNLVLVPVRRDIFGWGALTRTPETAGAEFVRSEGFEAGAMYRVLAGRDGKVSMYQLLRAGARLDSEPFPESIHRSDFKSLEVYRAFLLKRKVDYVLIYDGFDRHYGSNEHALLETLVEAGAGADGLCARLMTREPTYDVYRLRRSGC